jgi:hypothetical protein
MARKATVNKQTLEEIERFIDSDGARKDNSDYDGSTTAANFSLADDVKKAVALSMRSIKQDADKISKSEASKKRQIEDMRFEGKEGETQLAKMPKRKAVVNAKKEEPKKELKTKESSTKKITLPKEYANIIKKEIQRDSEGKRKVNLNVSKKQLEKETKFTKEDKKAADKKVKRRVFINKLKDIAKGK